MSTPVTNRRTPAILSDIKAGEIISWVAVLVAVVEAALLPVPAYVALWALICGGGYALITRRQVSRGSISVDLWEAIIIAFLWVAFSVALIVVGPVDYLVWMAVVLYLIAAGASLWLVNYFEVSTGVSPRSDDDTESDPS